MLFVLRTTTNSAASDVRSHSTLSASDSRFVAVELMRRACGVRGPSTSTGDGLHAIAVHRREATAAAAVLLFHGLERRRVGLRRWTRVRASGLFRLLFIVRHEVSPSGRPA